MNLITNLIYIPYKGILKKKNNNWINPNKLFPNKWRSILTTKVVYYNNLDQLEKELFEHTTFEFLWNCKIIEVDTTNDDIDKILVATNAIIPIFSFPDWQYINLVEVLIYSAAFNE